MYSPSMAIFTFLVLTSIISLQGCNSASGNENNTPAKASVKDFGAIGDGIKDDTTAFINAISSRKSIYVPNGRYLIKRTITLKAKTSIVGENKEESILLFEGVDGFNFKPQALNDGYLNIENISLQFKGTPIASSKGLDFTGVNYSRVHNTNIKFFGTGIFISRLVDSFGVNGCYFNNIHEVNIYWSKIGIDINDNSGYSCNSNRFSNIYYKGASLYVENALAFQDHTAYRVTGYGNSFHNIYGGGYSGENTTFMEFGESPIYHQSLAGGNTIINPYIESSPKFAFKIPTTTSRRLGNLIINPTFDGVGSKFKYYDPKHELSVISSDRNDIKDSHFQKIGNAGTADLAYGEDIFIPNAVNGALLTIINPQDGISGVIIVRNLGEDNLFAVTYAGEGGVQSDNMTIQHGKDSLFEYNYIKELDKIFIRKAQ